MKKLDKSAFFVGDKGTYADITLLENKDGADQYGNHFMVVQDLGKERRESGEKGPILGNGKIVAGNTNPQQPAPARKDPPRNMSIPSNRQGDAGYDDDSDIPF